MTKALLVTSGTRKCLRFSIIIMQSSVFNLVLNVASMYPTWVSFLEKTMSM